MPRDLNQMTWLHLHPNKWDDDEHRGAPLACTNLLCVSLASTLWNTIRHASPWHMCLAKNTHTYTTKRSAPDVVSIGGGPFDNLFHRKSMFACPVLKEVTDHHPMITFGLHGSKVKVWIIMRLLHHDSCQNQWMVTLDKMIYSEIRRLRIWHPVNKTEWI